MMGESLNLIVHFGFDFGLFTLAPIRLFTLAPIQNIVFLFLGVNFLGKFVLLNTLNRYSQFHLKWRGSFSKNLGLYFLGESVFFYVLDLSNKVKDLNNNN
jgi:uncharacterized membrane-anchored protein YitT (DUF2179 family)